MAFFLLSLHNQLEAEMMRQMIFELARKQVHQIPGSHEKQRRTRGTPQQVDWALMIK